MTRSTPEWIGKKDNTPPPQRVKDRIIAAQGGLCACGCGAKLGRAGERIEFDHVTALILGGENREGNIRALRRPCHVVKTKADVRQKSVEARKRGKALGIKTKPARPFPGSRDHHLKRKIGGGVVPRWKE